MKISQRKYLQHWDNETKRFIPEKPEYLVRREKQRAQIEKAKQDNAKTFITYKPRGKR